MADENNNLLTVREFEKIYCKSSSSQKDNEKYILLEKDYFDELKTFIDEHNSNSDSEEIEDKEDDDNLKLYNFISSTYDKNVISVKNYVGLIQLESGFQIEILPKVDLSGLPLHRLPKAVSPLSQQADSSPTISGGASSKENDDFDFQKINESKSKELTEEEKIAETKKVFLEMLEYFLDFTPKKLSTSNIDIQDMSILEIFIKLFVEEVKNLVKQGLKSSYITIEDNVPYFKGKFLVNQHLKHNLCHKERFYMAYDEFNLNRPENRLIKSALSKLRRITTNWENSKEIKMLLNDFEMVDESLNYNKDLSKVKIDRNTLSYASIIQWVKVFLFNKSFTNFSGDGKNKALLFNMNELFESYVAKKVEEIFTPVGWIVSAQDKQHHLFEKPKMFQLRPDIVIKKDYKKVILDTKWKVLNNSPRKNYGISPSDMYQMYAYSKKYSAENNNKPSDVWLLYPKNEGFDLSNLNWKKGNGAKEKINEFVKEIINDRDIYYIEYKEFKEDNNSNNTTVRVFFVDVAADLDNTNNSNSINSLCTIIKELLEKKNNN